MMTQYQPFVQKYRPRRFSELVGQEGVVSLLQSAFLTNSIAPAYLFSGPHGVGKTSTARLFAKLINCLSPDSAEPCNTCEICREINGGASLDVIEIDAASNRRIDEIRQLRETVKFAPVKAKYKVYIIDEVHMLTLEAFNALLKTLEEPPSHVKFILATTHPHKLPPTVVSRCQRVEFSRASDKAIRDYLIRICQKEDISLEEDVLEFVVRRANGCLRDAGALLEQVAVLLRSSEVSWEELIGLLSLGGRESTLKDLLISTISGDVPSIVKLLNQALQEGIEPESIVEFMETVFRAGLLAREGVPEELWGIGEDKKSLLREVVLSKMDEFDLFYSIQILIKMRSWLRTGVLDRLAMELGLIKIARRNQFKPVNAVWNDTVTSKSPLNTFNRQDSRSLSTKTTSPLKDDKAQVSSGVRKTVVKRQIPDFWRKILVELMRSRNMLLAHVLQDVWSVQVKGDLMEVVFTQKFSFESMKEEKNLSLLKATVSSVLGKEYRFRFSVLPKGRDEEKDTLLEEKINMVLKTFGGKVVERGKLRDGSLS